MSKDVIIAGSVAVCCIALIAVAVLAPKSKSEPSTEPPKVDVSLADGTQPLDAQGIPGAPLTTDHPLAPGAPGTFGSTTAPGLPPLGNVGNSSTAPVTVAPWNPQGPVNGNDLNGNLPAPAPVPVEPPPAPAKEQKIHVVANGELLGDIALHYYGSSKQWKRIVEANPGLNPNHVKVGQKLVIPALDKTPAPTTGAAPAPGGERTYTVKKNDGYHSIAARELGSASRWKEIEKLNGVPSTELKIGQVIKLPPATTAPAPTTGGDAAPAPAGAKTHTVAAGEHLADIAKKYYGKKSGKAEWKKIVSANPGINPDRLKVGQKLTIPDVAGAAPAPTTDGATPAPTPAPAAAEGAEYTIQKGDTPQVIAKRELGAKASKKEIDALAKSIVALNPGINPTNLRIGQKIKLPAKGGSAPAAPAPPPAPAAPAIPGGFGAPAAPGGFGAPAAPGGANGFGAPAPTDSAFGAPITPAAAAPGASAFGAPPASGFGAPAPAASDFASPYANSNQGFGAPTTPPAGPTTVR